MKINTASTEDASCQRQFNSVCSALGVSSPIAALWSVNIAKSVELKRHWTVFPFSHFLRSQVRLAACDCVWRFWHFRFKVICQVHCSLLHDYYLKKPSENINFAQIMSDNCRLIKVNKIVKHLFIEIPLSSLDFLWDVNIQYSSPIASIVSEVSLCHTAH